jgi:xylulokinase
VLARDVTALERDGGPAYGAALLAGVGAGIWRTVDEACAACLGDDRGADRRRPQPANLPVYRARLQVYREVHRRLQPLYRRAEETG